MDKEDTMDKTFVTERLCKSQAWEPKQCFHATLPRENIYIGSVREALVKNSGKPVSLGGQQMYMQQLAINDQKHSITRGLLKMPELRSLFIEEGIMKIFKNSNFMHKLEELVKDLVIAPLDSCDALEIDENALTHIVPDPKLTLGNLYFLINIVYSTWAYWFRQ